jgi:hypothetical protein
MLNAVVCQSGATVLIKQIVFYSIVTGFSLNASHQDT